MNKTSKILVTAVVTAATFLQGLPSLGHLPEIKDVNGAIENTSIVQVLQRNDSVKLDFFQQASAASLISSNITLKDIKGNWAESLIKEAVSKGIIKGYSDGTFKPNNPISSIESYAIAFRTAGVVDDAYAKTLKDWTVPYIDYYKASGYDTDTFNPELTKNDATSTREKALYVLLKAKGIDFGYNTDKSFARMRYDTKFTDVGSGDSYALYIRYAQDHNIVKGYSTGDFGFGKNVTRAEFVKMALGIFGRTDLTSTNDYITKVKNGQDTYVGGGISTSVVSTTPRGYSSGGGGIPTITTALTYSDNVHIKGQSFSDSTKVVQDGKYLYNGHWYFMQSQDYYDQMNINKTPIQSSGSLGTSRIIVNTVDNGWKFTDKDGARYSDSGDVQRNIDIIRYNENFYFGDLNNSNHGLPAFGGTNTLQEFKLIYKQVAENYGNYSGSNNIFKIIGESNSADSTFNAQSVISFLNLLYD